MEMNAIVSRRFGPPEHLIWAKAEKPVPRAGEVLVRVKASSVNTQNLLYASGQPRFVRLMGIGLLKPAVRIPGNDVAGVVEKADMDAHGLRPGDAVFGELSACGSGAYAEYVRVPAKRLARKPDAVSFEAAAGACEAALVALHALCVKGDIRAGQRVLIYGASGGIGSFAVQLAKIFGAEVTAVCSAKNFRLVESLGADHVLDYTRGEYPPMNRPQDLVLGVPFRPLEDHLRALAPGGVYVSTGGPQLARVWDDLVKGRGLFKKHGKRIAGGWTVAPAAGDLQFIADQMRVGRLRTPIDQVFPITEVAQAFRYYAQGRTRGKLILTVP